MISIPVHIRTATSQDIPVLIKLYTQTILSVNRKDYTSEEVVDWALCGKKPAHWKLLFAVQHFLVAETPHAQIVGFASVNDVGYLHTLFVHKDFQRHGVASRLYAQLEDYAQKRGADRITTEVSITAKPFFERQGFVTIVSQKRKAKTRYLINYKMEKPLYKPLSELTHEELGQRFPILLTAYNRAWEKEYVQEAQRLKEKLGNAVIEQISHIGSTAVPGLLSKPTIDILLEVKRETDLEFLQSALENIGYLFSPQLQKPAPHMMYLKGYTPKGFEPPVYHVHVRYPGDWDEICFRDYLRSHPEAVREYAALKRVLKTQFEHDRDGYTEAKSEFIHRIIRLGRAER